MSQHLVVACLLHVQDLALERKDRLEAPVAPLLCGSTGGFTLDQVQLAALGIAFAGSLPAYPAIHRHRAHPYDE